MIRRIPMKSRLFKALIAAAIAFMSAFTGYQFGQSNNDSVVISTQV